MATDKGYTHGDAFDEGYLQVSDLHRIFYTQYGKRDGKPVVFLHGGPGGSGSPKVNTSFFDPAVYRVVLFDQRGACRSEPATETRENTTQLLIEDIEKLRKHVGVKKWHMVFGGSWGSTLSLAYAQAHPEATGSLVLRGVFFGTKAELQLGDDCMLSKVWPEVYDRFIEYLPAEKRHDPLEAYHELIMSPDHNIAYPAAKAWNRLEMSCSNLTPKAEAEVEALLADERWCMSHAKMEVHYFVNGCFMGPTELRDGCEKIKHVPTRMIQGRYDLLCPPRVAWELQKRLSNSQVHWTDAGHSAFDPSTLKQLIHYTDELGKSDFHLQ